MTAITPGDFGIGALYWRIREAVIVGDASTARILLWNPAAERMFGYTPDEIVGEPLERLVPDALREAHRAGLRRYATTGETRILGRDVAVELPALRKDGVTIAIELSLSALDPTPRVPRPVLAVVRDVTERKRTEELRVLLAREQAIAADMKEQATTHAVLNAELRRLSEERDEALAEVEADRAVMAKRARHADLAREVGDALVAAAPLRERLQRCAQSVVRHVGAAFARVWVLDPSTDTLVLQASAGRYTHLDGAHSRVRVGELKIGAIARERLPHLTNSVLSDPRVSDPEWAKAEGMVAFAGYPLVVADRLVGVLAMFATAELDALDLQALETVAHVIALGVAREPAPLETGQRPR